MIEAYSARFLPRIIRFRDAPTTSAWIATGSTRRFGQASRSCPSAHRGLVSIVLNSTLGWRTINPETDVPDERKEVGHGT